MTKPPPDFLTEYLAGRIEADTIDDYIDAWHGPDFTAGPRTETLYGWLGMTWGQFQRWLNRGELPTRTGAAEPPPPSPEPSDRQP